MRNSEKTPEGFRKLAAKSREAGEESIANLLEQMAQEKEAEAKKKK